MENFTRDHIRNKMSTPLTSCPPNSLVRRRVSVIHRTSNQTEVSSTRIDVRRRRPCPWGSESEVDHSTYGVSTPRDFQRMRLLSGSSLVNDGSQGVL